MKNKFLKGLVASFALAVSGLANAGLITVENWHDTSDGFQGLKQSNFSDDIFYAVSLTGVFNNLETYEMIEGYRWATEQDYLNAWANRDLVNGDFLTDSTPHPYYNQGGWSRYVWNGITRYEFIFSDTLDTGRSTHAGTIEGYTSTWAFDYVQSYTINDPLVRNWGGFVLVNDDSQGTASVPEPSTLTVFALGLMGLASRKFKKQA